MEDAMSEEDDVEAVASDLGEFDGDWNESEEAADFQEVLLPEQAYQCGVQDHSWLKSDNSGNRGLKIVFEIIEPAVVKDAAGEDVEVRGKTIDHVFWISKKNIPYVKRDVHTLTGQEIKAIRELMDINWMECFVEIVNKHDTYDGRTRNKVAFFNEWSPATTEGTDTPPGEAQPATKESDEV
jgi:hypothetical protein